LLVPELVSRNVQNANPVPFPTFALLHEVTLAETWAELVKEPNKPKTKPAIAIAAISVMAISITVANTGEIAFLCLRLLMCMLVAFYDQTPVNGAVAPLLRETEPTACDPAAE